MSRYSDEVWKNDADLISATFDEIIGNGSTRSADARVVIALVSATGIIENGGLLYFFESDFPDGVSHNDIASFYELVGMPEVARIIRSGLLVFPDGLMIEELNARRELLANADVKMTLEKEEKLLFISLHKFEEIISDFIRRNIFTIFQNQ